MNRNWDRAGWLTGVQRIASPNCDERPAGLAIRLIVIHAISLPPGEYGGDDIEKLFTNRLDPDRHPYFQEIHSLRVSAHFLIRRDGALLQFVPCAMRAWHAGVSAWEGIEKCNDFSIGIELEGCDDDDFDGRQYSTLLRLLSLLKQQYPIEAVVGHSDIASGRKTDPGPKFEWARLHENQEGGEARISKKFQQRKLDDEF